MTTSGLKIEVLICLSVVLILGIFVSQTGAQYPQYESIPCYQCNTFSRGTQDVCHIKPAELANCTCCMKTYTRAYLQNQFNDFVYASTVSRYCIRPKEDLKPEGCYKKRSAGGYSIRCYCYSGLCNTSALHVVSWITISLLTLGSVLLGFTNFL